jgi:mediator of replication checkpoint protein 1
MGSSRESSPANESSPIFPHQLTPNSKVKALLASLDDDSDDGNVSGSARARLLSTIAKKPASKPTSPLNTREKSQNGVLPREPEKDSETGDEEDDDEIVRPKGRIAARMHVAGDKSEPEAERLTEDARERVKRMLTTKSTSSEPTIGAVDFEESDEDHAPILSRNRKIRVPRRSSPTPSPQKVPASPGLFVSPAKPATTQNESSDEDLPSNPLMNDRFKALVEKKRQERLEKEAKEADEKAKKTAERKKQAMMLEKDDDISDDNVERRLTQQAKPTRKASKRAKEEIARETQRLSRSMQLTHEARTRKKATKADLFKRFNYRPVGGEKEQTSELARPASSSSAPHSDVEVRETPPTSPASHENAPGKISIASDPPGTLQQGPNGSDEDDLPTLEEVLPSSLPRKLDKGKGRAVEPPEPEVLEKKPQFKQRPIRIRPPMASERQTSVLEDSDSDLEVVAATTKLPDARRNKLDSIFNRIPARQAKESHAVKALKIFAHLKSPGKQHLGRNKKLGITTTELQLSLQQRAREQAKREREEKYEALRAKGIYVQTAEEREKALAEVEDLMARARREGEQIRKKEKEAAKREREAKGEVDPLGDSSDDEDWKKDKETFAEQLSGSGSDDGEEEDGASDASGEEDDEEEEDELELGSEADAEATQLNSMFDNEADETEDVEVEAELSGDEEMAEADAAVDDQEEEDLPPQITRRVRKSNVISDEEDDEPVMETDSPMQLHTDSPRAPNSVLRSATKTFIPGLTVAGPAGLGLTQIFAGTMDDSQTALFDEPLTVSNSFSQLDSEQDSMAFLRRIPPPDLPPFVPTMEDSQDVVVDSQSGVSHLPESQNLESQNTESQSRRINLTFSQSQIHNFDSLVDPIATQSSDFPEATQDVGFQHMTPIRGRFVDAPPSTVDTVIIKPASVPEPFEETPIAKKKGKLRQRAQVAAFSDEEDAEEPTEVETQEEEDRPSANVFDVMRKASKGKGTIVDEFDKKTSKAKEMVHDQAEESEDEYAGLGGASDDESGDEADEYVKAMIDDEGGKEVDERKLAAFFA